METVKISKVHPKDYSSPNPRIQCPKCAKWKRHSSRIKEGDRMVISYNFFNLPNDGIGFGYQELCRNCYEKIIK